MIDNLTVMVEHLLLLFIIDIVHEVHSVDKIKSERGYADKRLQT